MPDIYVHHYECVGLGGKESSAFNFTQLQEFLGLLKAECARRFTVPEWQLAAGDFTVYDMFIPHRSSFTDQTNDVIFRINLHHFPLRVAQGDENAAELAELLSKLLNTPQLVQYRGRVTVGVSLVFAEIAWATA